MTSKTVYIGKFINRNNKKVYLEVRKRPIDVRVKISKVMVTERGGVKLNNSASF